MANKVFVSGGGYLRGEDGKLKNIAAGVEVEIEEAAGNACRFLTAKNAGKKVTVATPEKKK
jgi:hypothetical protein